ncbi:MAG: hypothetical protein KatS3mg108_0998 [Isosphaeraceae bacterium]|jgi:hypothetical protein|nr:MAG: hypothetical protein KatS3mg108_0998 [Isosphaeraceae bacterium]
MAPEEIRMCVADVLQDDDIENIDSILRMLNFPDEPSWRASRGAAFTDAEVREALRGLMADGLVTPYVEHPPSGQCVPIPVDDVDTQYPWDTLWFHLEPEGRDAVRRWWETEGGQKYPNPE